MKIVSPASLYVQYSLFVFGQNTACSLSWPRPWRTMVRIAIELSMMRQCTTYMQMPLSRKNPPTYRPQTVHWTIGCSTLSWQAEQYLRRKGHDLYRNVVAGALLKMKHRN